MEAAHGYRVWRRVNDEPWTIPTVRVWATMEAAKAYAGEIAGEKRILPADVGPVLSDPASLESVRQAMKT
jgi:hypothetical protein